MEPEEEARLTGCFWRPETCPYACRRSPRFGCFGTTKPHPTACLECQCWGLLNRMQRTSLDWWGNYRWGRLLYWSFKFSKNQDEMFPKGFDLFISLEIVYGHRDRHPRISLFLVWVCFLLGRTLLEWTKKIFASWIAEWSLEPHAFMAVYSFGAMTKLSLVHLKISYSHQKSNNNGHLNSTQC